MKNLATIPTALLTRQLPIRMGTLLLLAVLAWSFSAQQAAAQCTASDLDIVRTSAMRLLSSQQTANDAQYASYMITNTGGTSCNDIWVTISGLDGPYIFLGSNEDGFTRLGTIAPGASEYAFFYLESNQVPPNVDEAPTEMHQINVYEGQPANVFDPDDPANFPATRSVDVNLIPARAINANPHKLTSATLNGDDTVGGFFTITITGFTATIGADDLVIFSPSTLHGWPAASYELVSTTYSLNVTQGSQTGTNIPGTNSLVYDVQPGVEKIDFTATFRFQIESNPGSESTAEPLFYISSGQQNKHSNAEQLGVTVPEPVKEIGITKEGDPLILTFTANDPNSTDQVVYTVVVTNNSAEAQVEIDDIIDTLCEATPPSGFNGGCPSTPSYVANTANVSTTGAGPQGQREPAESGPNVDGEIELNWDGPWLLDPTETVTIEYTVEFTNYDPEATVDQDFDNCAVARVGATVAAGPACVAVVGNGNLPVELVAFDAVLDGRQATLRWRTASETNNAGFEVQHRYVDQAEKSTSFAALGWIDGAGTTEQAQSYDFRIDALEPGRHVFRLKQIDYDGTFDYSPEIEVAVEMPEAYLVTKAYPNPFNPQASFSFGVRQQQQVVVEVFDMLGRRAQELYRGTPEAGTTQTVFIDGSDLTSGIYLIRVLGERFVDTQTITLIK